jgi:methylenetetrahydrofolate reductase (NADPH)
VPGDDLSVSFEFFPPNTPEAAEHLWTAVRRLETLQPRFVSVTYGAGGTTRERTHAIVTRILAETSLLPAAHLTCVGASREEIDDIARAYWEGGVRHLVALRGDPPGGLSESYQPHPGGYAYAADLVAGLKRVADFEISVAAFPEVHPEAVSPEQDLDNLKRKLDAGACRAITQFFFDAERYLRFVDRARAAGIEAPIVPGIFPITNFARTVEFAKKCGATVPDWLRALFEGVQDHADTRNLVAAVAAAELCRQLQAHGVNEFHFYTLNRAELTTAICHMLRAPAPITGPAGSAPGLGR